MPGVVVDGQSALEMYEVGGEAVKRARRGEGPTLIEAQTYRYQGHFGADNTLLYRTEEEEAYYHARDCIERLRTHLIDGGVATQEQIQAMDDRALAKVEGASKFADESPFPEPEELYADVYVSYP
jgi:pyruvate dehydrogenase E1 component alpha subunit